MLDGRSLPLKVGQKTDQRRRATQDVTRMIYGRSLQCASTYPQIKGAASRADAVAAMPGS
jgi:hypothetical protein